MAVVFTETTWITLIIFMFLVVIGYLKKDPIMHLISVVIGILMTIQFFSSDPYLGFSMGIISIYLAYYALIVEWDRKG
ncbi:MAG: hypothetical protein ACXADW_23615 [Candidatus Hodarchaeales archaeon]|jgi:hypothetical protein